jgi:hypothetical protein
MTFRKCRQTSLRRLQLPSLATEPKWPEQAEPDPKYERLATISEGRRLTPIPSARISNTHKVYDGIFIGDVSLYRPSRNINDLAG